MTTRLTKAPARPARRPASSPAAMPVQAKVAINPPNDAYEIEADRIATAITSGSARCGPRAFQRLAPSFRLTPLVQRLVDEDVRKDEEEEEVEELVQAKPGDGFDARAAGKLDSQMASLRGGGRPMSPPERQYFEPRFGYDFTQVRIHAGSRAADAARSIGARAFTTGTDVVFGGTGPTLATGAGRQLFAHELTHVIQQTALRQGGVQRQLVQRAPDDTPTLVKVVIYKKGSTVVATLSDGSQIRLRLTKTTLEAGTYQGHHTHGAWIDQVKASDGTALASDKGWRFVHKEKTPPLRWADIPTSPEPYELVVFGLRTEGTLEEEIAARASSKKKKGAGTGAEGTGAGVKGKGKGTEGAAKEPTEKKEGAGKEGKEEGKGGKGEPEESDKEKKERLKRFFEALRGIGLPEKKMSDTLRATLESMDAAQQADLLRFLQDVQSTSDEDAVDMEEQIDKFLNMSPSDRELLRVNLELKQSKAGGALPEQVRIALDVSAEETAAKGPEAVKKVNEQLANLAAIHRKVTHDTLIDKEGASLEPIDLEKLPVFREMMMLEGLLAGASTKSSSIESHAKELTRSIAGIRDYVLEEILWLAGEMAVGAIIGALTGPLGTGAAIARGALLLQRLNKLRLFLQKVERVYSTYARINGIITSVLSGYGEYRKFKPQFEAWMKEIEALKTAVEDPNIEEDVRDQIAEKLEALEDRVIDEMLVQLESGSGLGAILEYFDIPAEATEDDLKEILFNIPRGVEELKRLKGLYEASGKDLEATKTLAYRSVLVGVLLYPFVGFLARETGAKLAALMPEKDLGDRLIGVIGRAGKGHKGYKAPGGKATRGTLTKAKKPKAARKGKKTEAEKKAEKPKDDQPTQKSTKAEGKPKKGDAASEWIQVEKKVSRLPDRYKDKGITESALKTQAKAIRKAHKKVAGRITVKAVPDRGYWKLTIARKPAGSQAEAVVLMGYNERWARGKTAVERKVDALSVEQTSKSGLEGAIAPLKEPFQYASLKIVNRLDKDRAGFSIVGAMGRMKDREITTVDDVQGLHKGTEGDPIPIYWYKDPSWYPGYGRPLDLTIDGKKQAFTMTSSATVTLKSGDTVTIGVNPANIVKPGTKLKRHSQHARDYGQVDRLKKALKTAGYTAWENKDIDHVTDLAFRGTNKYSNLWPLNKEKNRHAFSGMWYRNYGIEYLDKANSKKSRVSTLYKLQHKWFTILDSYKTQPRKLGGRSGKET
jgi:hypothetical protein